MLGRVTEADWKELTLSFQCIFTDQIQLSLPPPSVFSPQSKEKAGKGKS